MHSFSNHFIDFINITITQNIPIFVAFFFLVMLTFYKNKVQQKYFKDFLITCIFIFVIGVFDAWDMYFSQHDDYHVLRLVCFVVSLSLKPGAILCLLRIGIRETNLLSNHKKTIIGLIHIPLIFNVLIYSSGIFSPKLFYFTTSGELVVNSFLIHFSHSIAVIYTLILLYLIKKYYSKFQKSLRYVFYALCLTIISGLIIESFGIIRSIVVPLLIFTTTYWYCFLLIQVIRHDNEEKENEMQKSRNALLISQIQPHFIYNTLASIRELCYVDSIKAAGLVDNFSSYLRENIDTLGSDHLNSIVDELKHVKRYYEIEKVRFDNINLVCEIEDEDVMLPALTIQPLVENSIKYGIRSIENGTVTIKSFFKDGKHIIEVIDNGVGFDVNEEKNDGRDHVGIKNVKERIENICSGTLTIESNVGEGTKVTIIV